MFCKNCGTQLSDDSKFCYNCGYKTDETSSNESTVSTEPNDIKIDNEDVRELVINLLKLQ